MTDTPQLRHGSEWADHEDCLVGNELGLKRLRDACDIALRDGEYYGGDLGEFVGVKKLDSKWFDKPEDSKPTRIANLLLAFVLICIFGLFLVGAITVIRWLL